MKTPFFSIIIPAFNEELYLPRLLSNLHKQTFQNFEVIVVDGGSSDGTATKVKQFNNRIPHLSLKLSKQANVGAQRNLGAKLARGAYLVFLDADVQISKNFFSKIHSVILKNNSILLTTLFKADSSDSRDRLIAIVGNISMQIGNLLDKPFVGGFNIIIHSAMFDAVGGFDTSVVHGEDHDFVQRCHKAGIRLAIIEYPRLVFSFRRFKTEGYFSILRRYAHASLYILLKGPIKKALFAYPMGGQVYADMVQFPGRGYAAIEKRLLRSIRRALGI